MEFHWLGFSLIFAFFRGRCLWIFWGQVLVFGPCRYGIWVFCICFSTKICSYLFFQIFSGSLSCCLFATYFEFLGPHGPGFSIGSQYGFSGRQSQSSRWSHGVNWPLQRHIYPWPRGYPLKVLGDSVFVAPEDTCVLIRPTASASPGEVGLST